MSCLCLPKIVKGTFKYCNDQFWFGSLSQSDAINDPFLSIFSSRILWNDSIRNFVEPSLLEYKASTRVQNSFHPLNNNSPWISYNSSIRFANLAASNVEQSWAALNNGCVTRLVRVFHTLWDSIDQEIQSKCQLLQKLGIRANITLVFRKRNKNRILHWNRHCYIFIRWCFVGIGSPKHFGHWV